MSCKHKAFFWDNFEKFIVCDNVYSMVQNDGIKYRKPVSEPTYLGGLCALFKSRLTNS